MDYWRQTKAVDYVKQKDDSHIECIVDGIFFLLFFRCQAHGNAYGEDDNEPQTELRRDENVD